MAAGAARASAPARHGQRRVEPLPQPGRLLQNAARVLGRWQLWRATEAGPELVRLDVVPQGCRLHASLQGAEGEGILSMSGEITAMGVWYLAPDPLAPSAPDTLVLAGTGPAYGVDLAKPGHLLRAFRP